MENAHIDVTSDGGCNERARDFTPFRPKSANRAPRFRHRRPRSPLFIHSDVGRFEMKIRHWQRRWWRRFNWPHTAHRTDDVSAREKSNVTSGAEGATTARGRAGDKEKASLALALSFSILGLPSVFSFSAFPPSLCSFLLSAHCRCHLWQKGAREEPECRAAAAEQITNKTNILAGERERASPRMPSSSRHIAGGDTRWGPFAAAEEEAIVFLALPRHLDVMYEKGTQHGSGVIGGGKKLYSNVDFR